MDLIEEELKKESHIGKKLSDFTIKKVIICVLLMVFIDPLFRVETYLTDTSHEQSLTFLYKFKPYTKIGKKVFNNMVEFEKDIDFPLLYLHAQDNSRKDFQLKWKNDKKDYTTLRNVEVEVITLPKNPGYYALYDIRDQVLLASGLGICRTIFVCFILALGSHMFSKTTQDLVILPIEHMIEKVN